MIRINTIKIGNAEIFADEKLLNDLASHGGAPRSDELRKLDEEIRRAKRDLDTTTREHDKGTLRSHIEVLGRRAGQLRQAIVGELQQSYGREIVSLSQVFVQVDDITADQIFVLRQSEIDDIRELLAEVELDFEDEVDADSLREAALLFEHVQMLLKTAGDSEQKQQLQEMADRLNELLKGLLESEQATGSVSLNLSRSDLHDLQMMLGQNSDGNSILLLLVSILRRTWKKILQRR
jgi:hypothetical protein